MSSPLWRFVLFAAGMSGLVSGQNVPLNQADGWSPMGDSPVVVRWDNEAEAATYQDTTTAEILRNHAAPYGITCRRARELVCGGSYQVKSGSSQWKALSGFTHFTGGFVPYFTAAGELVAEPLAGSGARRSIDNTAPVLSCLRREKRYGVISQVLIRDRNQRPFCGCAASVRMSATRCRMPPDSWLG